MTADRLRTGTRRGFTLVEMIVVMAIVILLFIFLVGGLADLAASRKLYNAVEQVANSAALARSKAISDNAIYHVRVQNKAADEQWIGVYRFKKTSDALKAQSELEVRNIPSVGDTWDDLKVVEAFDLKKLDSGTAFETQYDPAQLFLPGMDRVKTASAVHADPTELYYDPSIVPPIGPSADNLNLLPKVMPADMKSSADFPSDHRLLYFYPDGTASGNILFVLRDKQHLGYVRVWPGGLIRSGTIGKRKEYEDLK